MKNLLSLLCLLILIVSCTSNKTSENGETHNHDEKKTVTQSEFSEFNLTYVKPAMKTFSDTLKVRGMMHAPPMSKIDISLPYGGIVHEMLFYEGASVKKGDLLAVVKHPDYVDLQERYVESISEREKAMKNLERQEALRERESTPIRVLEEAQSQFQVAEARYNSLKAKLRLAGISPQKVERTGITDVVQVFSPSEGTISDALANTGMYLDPNKPIYRIIDNSHLHLELAVFPGDIGKIKIGQSVYFTFENSTEVHRGEVYLISQNVSETDRYIKVHVHPEKHLKELMSGMFVAAQLITTTDSALVIPHSSYRQDGNRVTALALEDEEIVVAHFDSDQITASGLRVAPDETRSFVNEGFSKAYAKMQGSGASAGHSH